MDPGPSVAWRPYACTAVDDYILGHVIREVMARGDAPGRSRPSVPSEGMTMGPYLRHMLDSGEFPNLAPLLAEGLPQIEQTFSEGLQWLLDGIARAHGVPDSGA
jgi:hypothetical protein